MTVRGIGGVFFKARDPEALAAWYERHLGIHRDDDGYSVFGWRLLDRPECRTGTVWSAFPADTEYFDPADTPWMINYQVDDLDETLARLADEGVEMAGDPESFEYGKFGWVLDPEGNKIELWEPPADQAFEPTVPAADGNALAGVWLAEPGTAMAAGTGEADPDADLVFEQTVSMPIAQVWRAWTTTEGVETWLTDCRIELRVGGPYELYFMDEEDAPPGARGSEGCKVLSFLPEKMLSFTWNAPPHLEHARPRLTHVVVELEPRDDETTDVRLTHTGWPAPDADDHDDWAEAQSYFQRAWGGVMDALAAHD